jgi:hypothetical protein
LQELAESDDMDQFMRNDVQAERHQGQARRVGQRGENGVVLQTNFIEIITLRTQRRAFAIPLIANDLGKRTLDNFIA